MAISVETFFLNPQFQGTLQSQIQQMIAEGILSGRFRVGERLPSTRRLATHLGISRITVTLAYTELLANDYLTSRGRSGYFVSENAPVPPNFQPLDKGEDRVDWSRAIGRQCEGMCPGARAAARNHGIPVNISRSIITATSGKVRKFTILVALLRFAYLTLILRQGGVPITCNGCII